jgi:hypothetical protein
MSEHYREKLFEIINELDQLCVHVIQEMWAQALPTESFEKRLRDIRKMVPLQIVIDVTPVAKRPIRIESVGN